MFCSLEICIQMLHSISIGNENKQSVLPPYILHSSYMRKRGGAMEILLLQIIKLLFFGLITITIIAIALIIALVVILSK